MFEAGATVALKSGGPVMTVDSVGDEYGTMTAWCVWFDGRKQVRASFAVTSLKSVSMDDD